MAPVVPPLQTTLVTELLVVKPALIAISGKVPHLGAIRAEFIEAQVLFGEASVHAKNKFVIVNDSPQV